MSAWLELSQVGLVMEIKGISSNDTVDGEAGTR